MTLTRGSKCRKCDNQTLSFTHFEEELHLADMPTIAQMVEDLPALLEAHRLLSTLVP